MKRPSFQFYPADHVGTYWLDIDPRFVFLAPNYPACYVIYLNDRLSYIGQTNNLRKRLTNHGIELARYDDSFKTAWGYVDSVKIKAKFCIKLGDWAMREIRLISRLKPKFNIVGTNNKKQFSKDLI